MYSNYEQLLSTSAYINTQLVRTFVGVDV